jgi:DNA polymerase-3 subunit epsilon
MSEFIAIDFETANETRCSACSVGVSIISENGPVDAFYSLLKPKKCRFSEYNSHIHGITAADVRDKPEFPEIWPQLLSLMKNRIVLAHNASFDFSVLRNTLTEYRIAFPEITYGCTRLIAKAVWPGRISYKLTAVARLLGIDFQHHDAMADARTCAEIADNACRQMNCQTLTDLAKLLGLYFGKILTDGEYFPPYGLQFHNEILSPTRTQSPNERPPASQKSSVRVFAFTGTLKSMERKQAMQLVLQAGGQPEERVTKCTNYLVVGDQDYRYFAEGETKSSKMRKAESLLAEGQDIEIISEEDFLQMIGYEADVVNKNALAPATSLTAVVA